MTVMWGLDYFITNPELIDEERYMKLIFCHKCWDMVKLDQSPCVRTCKCGAVAGRYLEDGHHAVVSPEAVVIGMNNYDLILAVGNKRTGDSQNVQTWLFPKDHKRIRVLPMGELESATLAVFD